MDSRAPGPDAFTRASAAGKDTARPSGEQGISPRKPREPRPDVPATLTCSVAIAGDPTTGAQAVIAQFAVPRPSALVLGPDPYLARLVKEIAVLAPALARGDVLELRRNGDAGENIGEHLAEALQLLNTTPGDAHERIVRTLVWAHRAGVDIGDLLHCACQEAASILNDDLTAQRPGSWESEHVRALSAGWDWEEGTLLEEEVIAESFDVGEIAAIRRRLELCLELLEPTPLPDTTALEQHVAAAMANRVAKHGRPQ